VPAPKSAFQIDYPSVVQAHSQRGVELVWERAGLSLAHAFQPVAHVKAVTVKDGDVGLGREFAVLGDPHKLALEIIHDLPIGFPINNIISLLRSRAPLMRS